MKDFSIGSNLFSSKLTTWYKSNHRPLPWRKTKDPYFIYLSEIILQQTQVKQGLNYYQKFTNNYPTIADLAESSEDKILKDWQGLGYYSRARNMHFAAKQIMKDFNGEFPKTYDEIIKLKGVGEYTAAAIASFAFQEAKAVVDGNVYRVISRLFNIHTPIDTTKGKKEFLAIANALLPPEEADTHNQAMMELGALICRPKRPDCESCPLQEKCQAYKENTIPLLPVKSKSLKQKKIHFNYYVFETEEEILIHRRQKKGIWQNLYDFHLKDTIKIDESNWIAHLPDEIQRFELIGISKEYVHLLTHKKILAQFIRIKLFNKIDLGEDYRWIQKDELPTYAIPKLIENYLMEEGNLLSLKL